MQTCFQTQSNLLFAARANAAQDASEGSGLTVWLFECLATARSSIASRSHDSDWRFRLCSLGKCVCVRQTDLKKAGKPGRIKFGDLVGQIYRCPNE